MLGRTGYRRCPAADQVGWLPRGAEVDVARAVRGDRSLVPDWVEPMLANPDGGRLRSGPEWAYEYKLDGYRAAMRIAADGTTVLTSRNGIDFTDEFASLVGVLA